MSEEEKYQLIENYLSGKLSDNDLSEFNNRLASDDEFRKEVELHQQVTETLKGEKIHELKNTLAEVDKNWTVPQQEKVIHFYQKPIFRIGAIAASILLFFFAYQTFLTPSAVSNQKLFSENFESYKMVLSQRSAGEDSVKQIALNDGISAYQKEDYKTASVVFNELQIIDPDFVAYPFYHAISEMNIGNIDGAINIFQSIIDKGDHLFMEQSRWYLALGYLQKGDSKIAKQYLEQIENGAFKFEEAKKLLRELK